MAKLRSTPPNQNLVTPATRIPQKLPPLTLGSYFPPRFNVILEEEKYSSSEDEIQTIKAGSQEPAIRRLQFSDAETSTHPTTDAAPKRDNRSDTKIWHFVLMPNILLHDEGYYIFKFKSEEDKGKVINFGPYYFSNRPLILKPWVLDFEFDKEILSVVPIWVKFLGLPVRYWSIESLSEIASAVGRPMHTDLVTANVEKITYARILIEVDVSQPLTEVISIETPSGLWEQ
ncbi:hypothetical protein KY284_000683 [Solanum tuberosum]|nr:hypothetical protein KY284_000683 [Solanum tuberosum]